MLLRRLIILAILLLLSASAVLVLSSHLGGNEGPRPAPDLLPVLEKALSQPASSVHVEADAAVSVQRRNGREARLDFHLDGARNTLGASSYSVRASNAEGLPLAFRLARRSPSETLLVGFGGSWYDSEITVEVPLGAGLTQAEARQVIALLVAAGVPTDGVITQGPDGDRVFRYRIPIGARNVVKIIRARLPEALSSDDRELLADLFAPGVITAWVEVDAVKARLRRVGLEAELGPEQIRALGKIKRMPQLQAITAEAEVELSDWEEEQPVESPTEVSGTRRQIATLIGLRAQELVDPAAAQPTQGG